MKEKTRKKKQARLTVLRWLRAQNLSVTWQVGNAGLIKLYNGLACTSCKTIRECAAHLNPKAFAIVDRKPKAKAQPKQKPDKIRSFYKSVEWKRLRYDVLAANDGRCELCGAGKHHGATLSVDHIKPLRLHWDRRLDRSNLQVLCGSCNQGKGNRDDTDWREPSLKVLMGEAMK
jgi:hypothetical protein